MENEEHLIRNLIFLPKETQWFEFKHDNVDENEIGEYISALGNSATCEDKERAYLIWGIHDTTHDIIGTSFDPFVYKVGNEELENWLRRLLSSNAMFDFTTVSIDGKNVVLFTIQKAIHTPITFKKNAYIRSGSYKKLLRDLPALEVKLWNKLNVGKYETVPARENLDKSSLLSALNYTAYFDLTTISQPTDTEQILHYLREDLLIKKQDDGLYTITNAGALLFAKRLSEYPFLSRKRLRVIQYNGNSRLSTKNDQTFDGGYAAVFEEMIRYIEGLLPKTEKIRNGIRESAPHYPSIILRELVANALIHQDFLLTGVGPTEEIFDSRIEITNPGVPLVDINRIIDNPPKSRNETLAALMRRVRICEEQGSGWDKVVEYSEMNKLPAPRIATYQEATRVTVFDFIPLRKMRNEDKIWACYLHACLKYSNDETITNASLRDRFGLSSTENAKISRLIKATVKCGLIKPLDPDTAPRYMQYIPYWA